MHPRRAILDAIRDALAASTSPALPVYEADATALEVPCWQIAERAERRGELSTRESYERALEFSVTARGTTPDERDTLSEALEAALFGTGSAGSFELEWSSVALAVPLEAAGQRTYPATYELVAMYFSPRT